MICINSHPEISERAYEIFRDRLQTDEKAMPLAIGSKPSMRSAGTAFLLRSASRPA
jgi:hypothetical protein